MKHLLKPAFRFLFVLVLIGGIASMFPFTAEFFQRLPYWVLYPLRICAAIFLVFMLMGYLIDSGILQRLFGKK